MKNVSTSLGAGLLILAVLFMVLFFLVQTAQLPLGKDNDYFWYVLAGGIALTAALCALAFFTLSGQKIASPVTPDGRNYAGDQKAAEQSGFSSLRTHLRRCYPPFWQRSVRLLLITGDAAAIDRLLPTLRESQWLEGSRTVLLYGGPLTAEPDPEKYAALRRLRPRRPLDGIVRVIGDGAVLTAQAGDGDLRALEKISELLAYSAPVWLWQQCATGWPQGDRQDQPVGITLPHRASPDDIAARLGDLLPALRARGMAQLAENGAHDFLLRLAQRLEQERGRRAAALTPWLYASQRRIPLRGLMFGQGAPALPEAATAGEEPAPVAPHALRLPAAWQGIVDDCARIRGRRVGLPRGRALGWSLMAIMGLWGAGLLLSFALNYQQITVVAGRARDLAAPRTVSDAQLTALHALRNDAGRLQHDVREGAPLYRRFGLSHAPQLLDTLLPWYGAANNRLIRDPASAALAQALNEMVNSPLDSDRRARLAKAGYDPLKAWLMMARPEKADGAFYARVMAAVQPAREGISPALWQSLAPDLWAFYMSALPQQPQWKITPDAALVGQSRQVLLQQIGRRNAGSTLYENMLKSVRRNFADMTLEDMTGGTDARRLFTTNDVVPGMFTRQAWEGGVQQAIEKAANARREEIDWVLSDGRRAVSADLSPEAMRVGLTRRYFTDFAGIWLGFLNGLRLNPARNIADVTDQLTLISDVRQSPVIALMNTLAWQSQAGRRDEALSDSLIKSARELVSGRERPVIDQQAAGAAGRDLRAAADPDGEKSGGRPDGGGRHAEPADVPDPHHPGAAAPPAGGRRPGPAGDDAGPGPHRV